MHLCVKPLQGKVARPFAHFGVTEHQQGVLVPSEMSVEVEGVLTQFLVCGARVGDGGVHFHVQESYSRGPCRDHWKAPVSSEQPNWGGGIVAARSYEGPRVVFELQVHGHEGGDGLRADTIPILAVCKDVAEVVPGQQSGVGIDSSNGAVQSRSHAGPCPGVGCIVLREYDSQYDVISVDACGCAGPLVSAGLGPGQQCPTAQQQQKQQKRSAFTKPETHITAAHASN